MDRTFNPEWIVCL